MSKSDETKDRLECCVNGFQMSVAQDISKQPTSREKSAEFIRRKSILQRRDAIQCNPKSFTDPQKIENDREVSELTDKDVSAASGFKMINFDFICPFAWHGTSTDALISHLLHVLSSRHVSTIPSCIALIVDNASTNKSMFTFRAFGLLLESIPRLREVHLYFPTVGHTHNSVDAHFGNICRELKRQDVGTPEGMKMFELKK